MAMAPSKMRHFATMDDTAELEQFKAWVGRTDIRQDVVTAAPLVSLVALLDRDDPPPREDDAAPPLAHWLYFLPNYRQSEAGPDGHALRGSFLPPVPLPQRMWAGSRIDFVRPLRVGARIARLSRIAEVKPKSGRSGALLFVTVRHEVSDEEGLVLTDEHDIVFRRGQPPRGQDPTTSLANPPAPAPADEKWKRQIHPDPVLLFRYSAVTFNSHRIHYDQPYVTKVEGYPGLVVHGPLTATLLVDLFRRNRPDTVLKRFTFRALRPLYDTADFWTCGIPDDAARSARLWTRDAEGAVTMEATASW
jgi:3-methylfumaryl-CoA hydratase